MSMATSFGKTSVPRSPRLLTWLPGSIRRGGTDTSILPDPTHEGQATVTQRLHVAELHTVRTPSISMMTDSGIWLGEAGGRLMRRSVVRSWEPCAGVSGNRDTLHPVSSS